MRAKLAEERDQTVLVNKYVQHRLCVFGGGMYRQIVLKCFTGRRSKKVCKAVV